MKLNKLKITAIIIIIFLAGLTAGGIDVKNKIISLSGESGKDLVEKGKKLVEKISNKKLPPSPVEMKPQDELQTPDLILLGARKEVENGTIYDASYVSLNYPAGDVPSDRGACTDVVIRALRNVDLDLQKLIHEDMKKSFQVYPQRWGLEAPDRNIDHRRIPNQMCFLDRYGTSLTLKVKDNLDAWQWGDIVYWRFPDGREHCGIISDRKNSKGIPLVIHNACITREEDRLLSWEIIGHYRYPKE